MPLQILYFDANKIYTKSELDTFTTSVLYGTTTL